MFRSERLENARPRRTPQAAVGRWAQVINKIVTWDDLALLRSLTSLPILLKGILHPDDARLASEHGMDGVIVSNHGGRQVDGAIAALDALPPIVDAVGSDMPGAVRQRHPLRRRRREGAGALGADAVLLGRPYLWGLALDGQAGVETVLRMILAELDLTLALSGCATPAELDRNALPCHRPLSSGKRTRRPVGGPAPASPARSGHRMVRQSMDASTPNGDRPAPGRARSPSSAAASAASARP